jgi:5-methylcytosine-specific restriction protein A
MLPPSASSRGGGDLLIVARESSASLRDVADRRYNTQRWKRLRRLILQRDGGLCHVRGPNCTTIATTAHHILPSSQYTDRFFDPANLQASCGPCNHHGANVKHENRVNRQQIAALERVIDEQQAVIEQLVAQLAEYETGHPAEPARPRIPRIH